MRLWHKPGSLWYLNPEDSRYSVVLTRLRVDRGSEDDKSERPSSSELTDSQTSSLRTGITYMLSCTLVHPAYTSQILPSQRCFSCKHSQNCVLTYIDAEAVPLLGYLPQDVVMTSIFQYYHPDDLHILHGAYEKLVARRKTTRCSEPVRMKVCNGDYIIVNTQLSCFVNPWSKNFDFILSKHSIIK